VIELVLRALKLLLIGLTIEQRRPGRLHPFQAFEGGLLFVLQLIDDLYSFMQQGQFFIRCAVILQFFQPKLDALQAVSLPGYIP
jgi:hypothetical protein